MKPATRDIVSYVNAPLKAQGMLLYGPDLGLIRQRVQQVIATVLKNPDDPFGRIELSAEQVEADPARLYDELSAFSFTGEPRLLILRDASDSLTKHIEPALEALTPTTYFLMFAGDLAGKSSLRALIEKHPSVVAIPCYRDEGAGLDTLIRDTFVGYGLRAQPEVVRYLASALGGDRMIVLNEIEKISLYLGDEEETIMLETVMQLVGDNADRSQDDINHAVASGNVELLCRVLDRMLLEGVNGVAMVRGLQYYFQKLQDIHVKREQTGASIDAVIDGLRPPVFFKIKPILSAHARRWSADHVTRALERILSLEIEMKRFHDQQPARLGQALIGLARLPR